MEAAWSLEAASAGHDQRRGPAPGGHLPAGSDSRESFDSGRPDADALNSKFGLEQDQAEEEVPESGAGARSSSVVEERCHDRCSNRYK